MDVAYKFSNFIFGIFSVQVDAIVGIALVSLSVELILVVWTNSA